MDWRGRLFAPTQIRKLDSTYFIVDCWHNRILYNNRLDETLTRWSLFADDLAGPHSIASDSEFFVVEDTGRNSVRAYRRRVDGTFHLVQILGGVGDRPHRVEYDATSSAFYVIASCSQEITKLVKKGNLLHLEYKKRLPFLSSSYTRSFTILDGFMLFISGPGAMFKASYLDDSYAVLDTIVLPKRLHSMNDLFKTSSYYYLTATPRSMFRSRSIEGFCIGEWDDLYSVLRLSGTPYYLTEFEGRIFVPQIDEFNGIISFIEDGPGISDGHVVFSSGAPIASDWKVRSALPK